MLFIVQGSCWNYPIEFGEARLRRFIAHFEPNNVNGLAIELRRKRRVLPASRLSELLQRPWA